MPPQININELYSIGDKKKKNRTVCFDKILELCHRRIKTVSAYGGFNTFYEIPGILIGYPLFNINECMEYIINALRKNGFLIQILPPPHKYVIYLSWDRGDVTVNNKKQSLRPPATVLPPKQSPLRLF